jgi:2-methylcitrate dehydratase PrpD
MSDATIDFIHELRWQDLPAPVARRARLLVADTIAVSLAGRGAPASRIAADHALATYGHGESTLLCDARRTTPVGAAWANAVLANALDYDDGHRLTKGHPGAMIVPALLALAEARDASMDELLAAIVVGYEIAVRAGVELHRRESTYHASGAWGAVGVAAAAARLLGLDGTATRHALGLAEYHGPIAPIMRSCADPAMTKDACDLGARIGVESALLTERGYTGCESALLGELAPDLGERWTVEEIYLKAHPCCRWGHGAIRAALEIHALHGLEPADIEHITVRTFSAADGLSKGVPHTTEEAQYNVVWPVAAALARGRFGVAEVLGPFDDTPTRRLAEHCLVAVDPQLDDEFPDRRLTAVEVATGEGRFSAGPHEARGEPDDPNWESIALNKVRDHVAPARDGQPASRLGRLELGTLLATVVPSSVDSAEL